jgi:hypothetical protein
LFALFFDRGLVDTSFEGGRELLGLLPIVIALRFRETKGECWQAWGLIGENAEAWSGCEKELLAPIRCPFGSG